VAGEKLEESGRTGLSAGKTNNKNNTSKSHHQPKFLQPGDFSS
jgi:hypothetical protein